MLALCKDIKTLRQTHAYLSNLNGNKLPTAVVLNLTSLCTNFNDFHSSVLLRKYSRVPDTFIWNKTIKKHVNFGPFESAFCVYKQMRQMGVPHDTYTFPIINQAVLLSPYGFSYAKLIHCLAMHMGFVSNVYFCNTMIEVYSKNGCFSDALMLFNEMPERDLVSWTTMLGVYVCVGDIDSGFKLFDKMRKEIEPNAVTVIVMLQVCSKVVQVQQLHGYVLKNGIFIDLSVQNAILQMYVKLGSDNDSEILFDTINEKDVVSWNIMISMYSLKQEISNMTHCFVEMLREIQPSKETLTLIISGFADGKNLCDGKQVHCLAVKTGLYDDILKTSLLNFYAKCGKLAESDQLFSEVSCKNAITSSAMMSAFVDSCKFKEAIELFQCIVHPVADNLRSLAIAYSHLGALNLGRTVHGYVIRRLLLHTSLDTSILNMYIRCGSIFTAKICFERMLAKDLVTWTSMIEGYGNHGMGLEAVRLFHRMVSEGMKPNYVTFLSVLSACSHSGLINEGCELFYSMKWGFGVEPDLNHYTCLIDMLGRLGKIKEALAMILRLVCSPDSRIWGALLGACRTYDDHKLGEYVAKRIMELECDNGGYYYTLVSNVQASAQRWSEVEEVRSAMNGNHLMKQPGWSCVEIGGSVRGFVSGDLSHSCTNEIYEILRCLSRIMQVL